MSLAGGDERLAVSQAMAENKGLTLLAKTKQSKNSRHGTTGTFLFNIQ